MSRTPTKNVIGIVGLGLMGSALAERALRSGFHVVGFDIQPERCALLRKLGGEPVESPVAVASAARRLLFSLMTTAQVESVISDMGRALRRGSLIIDTSTGDPEVMMKLAARLRRRGIDYVDAMLAGSSAEARGAQVLVLAGGNRAAFLRCRDIFQCFARQAHHVGGSGSGARMKLVFNLALGLNRAALAEALAFAKAIGIAPVRALEILKEGAAYSRVMDTKGEQMIAGDFSARARLEQHLKDVRLILAAGRQAGARLPLSTRHRTLLEKLVRSGFGPLDNSAIIKAFEQHS